jgi:UDP-N-acetylmuramate dehydrogenase
VACGAGLLTQRLVYLAAKHGWGELELLAGLPGQLGGAVAMNAQDVGRFIRSIRLISFDGTIREFTRQALQFSYRYTTLEPGIVVEAVLEFPKVPPADAYERIRRALQYRNSTQEVRLPSAGCAFKNPPALSAGRLIDQAGMKGARIGDARISLRHANFIVNVGRATCDDVLSLMEHVQRSVQHAFGVALEPEVRLMGERWTSSPI